MGATYDLSWLKVNDKGFDGRLSGFGAYIYYLISPGGIPVGFFGYASIYFPENYSFGGQNVPLDFGIGIQEIVGPGFIIKANK